jgi:CheY-like chemotaxis protein
MQFLRQQGKYVRAPRPDLVLLDLMLPGMDGRAVLAEMRADPGLREIPVVVMTGTMAEPADDGGKTLDVQGFLTKPVDLKKFLGLVEQLKDFWKADMILPTAGEAAAAPARTYESL